MHNQRGNLFNSSEQSFFSCLFFKKTGKIKPKFKVTESGGREEGERHGRMARGGLGLPKVSLGPAIPYSSTPCGQANPEKALRPGTVFYPFGPMRVDLGTKIMRSGKSLKRRRERTQSQPPSSTRLEMAASQR